jgi:cytochrome c peroxidase
MRHHGWFRQLAAAGAAALTVVGCSDFDVTRTTSPDSPAASIAAPDDLDTALRAYLAQHGFTGRISSTLEARLGRRIDRQLADLGRQLWFDPIQSLNDDNACGGCHSPTAGFGDTQPIAIGIDNNGIVGPDRTGPRNQRRSPMVVNTAFFPTLMWNSRFFSVADDPFDNSQGFVFPDPEGVSLSHLPHLLTAQAFIPPTERVEQAGFHFPGDNDDIRNEVVRRLNESENYRSIFARSFPHVKAGAPITMEDFARAIAEFEFTLVFADAPIDRYARGIRTALTPQEKHGAVLFFDRAGCVQCHAVSGRSNEMFSDFREHVAGIPQIMPGFTNIDFDGPGSNEDFGLEQATGMPADRYAFRTSPLRNVAL